MRHNLQKVDKNFLHTLQYVWVSYAGYGGEV